MNLIKSISKLLTFSFIALASLVFVITILVLPNSDTNKAIDNSINDKANNTEPLLVSETLDYDDIYEYSSNILDIKAHLRGYKALSNEDKILKYSLKEDYYTSENIKKTLKSGNIYYDLDAYNANNDSTISLYITSSNSLNNKTILKQYSNTKLKQLEESYLEAGYKDISISTKTIKLFNKDTSLLETKYIDLDNNQVYQYTVFIINNKYLGTLNITSINEDYFDEVIEMFGNR